MPMSPVAANTPRYVLMEVNRPIGPNVVQLHAGMDCALIYGFSDKGHYDKFCANSELSLKPYPLVKGFLRNQIDALGDVLKLVVMDATGPSEPHLHAATLQAALEAQENRTTSVCAGYRLMLDQETGTYTLEVAPGCSGGRPSPADAAHEISPPR